MVNRWRFKNNKLMEKRLKMIPPNIKILLSQSDGVIDGNKLIESIESWLFFFFFNPFNVKENCYIWVSKKVLTRYQCLLKLSFMSIRSLNWEACLQPKHLLMNASTVYRVFKEIVHFNIMSTNFKKTFSLFQGKKKKWKLKLLIEKIWNHFQPLVFKTQIISFRIKGKKKKEK